MATEQKISTGILILGWAISTFVITLSVLLMIGRNQPTFDTN